MRSPREEVQVGTRTDAAGRENNEDACAVVRSGPYEVLAVADGAGGHAGGEVASATVISAIVSYFQGTDLTRMKPSVALRQALHAAQGSVREAMKSNRRLRDMRSTALVVIGSKAEAWVGHVGDSRAYLVRRSRAERLTKDDSLVQTLVDLGHIDEAAAKTHSKANVLNQAIGDGKDLEYHVTGPIPLESGDRIIACSDGLWEVVDDEQIIAGASANDPDTIAQALVAQALASSPSDNVTVGVMLWRDLGSRPMTGRHQVTTPAARKVATWRKRQRQRTNVVVLLALLLVVVAAAMLRWARERAATPRLAPSVRRAEPP